MSAERLAALKASAARTRLRMQLINGSPPMVTPPPSPRPQAFTRLMPKMTPSRPTAPYKQPGRS